MRPKKITTQHFVLIIKGRVKGGLFEAVVVRLNPGNGTLWLDDYEMMMMPASLIVISFLLISAPSVRMSHLAPHPLHQQDEEGKYAHVIKIGDKLYGVPAVQAGTFSTDIQQQTGRRWEELVYELNGEVR